MLFTILSSLTPEQASYVVKAICFVSMSIYWSCVISMFRMTPWEHDDGLLKKVVASLFMALPLALAVLVVAAIISGLMLFMFDVLFVFLP